MGKVTIRLLAVLLTCSIVLASLTGLTVSATDGTSGTEASMETEEVIPEGSIADENQMSDAEETADSNEESSEAEESSSVEGSSEAEESSSTEESSEAEESSSADESTEAEESSSAEESTEAEESSSTEESSEAEESSSTEESSEAEESSSTAESSEAEESSSATESSEAEESIGTADEVEIQELSDAAKTYIGLVCGITEAVDANTYQSFMDRLEQGYMAYSALSEADKEHPDVVSANSVWNYLLQQSQAQEPALITDTHWNLLANSGYPDPYEQGGIYINSLAAVGSGFTPEYVGSSDQTGWYLATNRSKNTNVYMDWSNGAYMGQTWYDVRVYYWCPDGDFYVSRSANMTAATSDLSERRIFLEFHFFQSGKAGQWAYEVSDFYGVMGSRDLDYVAGDDYYEGWAFPVNQNDNNSSVIGNVYTSSDTVMEIQWSKFSISSNTHKNGTQTSSKYFFLPYFATQKDSTYGWDDYACLFWTFHARKSDPMVLCHYTAGPLQAGLNGDPVVVRYYLTDDSAKPAGAGTVVPNSIFTTYGAKFKRFEDAVSYKGYNFTGWSINKNLGMTTEYINSSTTAWVKQSSSTIRYLTSAGDYRIGEHNSSSAYTLYGAGASWYGLKLADGLTHGTYEFDQDCTVTYRNNGSTVSVGLAPNDANYSTIRRVLLFGKYIPWTGNVQVIKTSSTDSSVKVSGAVYGLFSDAACTRLLASATTNSSGVAKFNYTITYGTAYYVKEIESPSGWLLNGTIYTVKETALETDKGTVTVYATNEPSTYVITTEVINGTIDPKITGIPRGESRTINSAANTGYVLKSVTIDGVAVDLSDAAYLSATSYAYIFSNISANHHIKVEYVAAGYIALYKTGANTGAPVAGGEYTVYSNRACTNEVCVLITDENGYAKSSPLYGRTYYVKESKARLGYSLNPTVITVAVSAGQTYTISNALTTEPEWYAQVYLYKNDSVTGNSIANYGGVMAIYEWSANSNAYVFLKNMTVSNNRYETEVHYSDTNLGKFKIVEAINPTGYTGTYEQEFAMDLDEGTAGEMQSFTYSFTATNIPRQISFVINKTDALDGEVISGALFKLEQWSEAAGEYVFIRDVPYVEANSRYESGTLSYTQDNLGLFRVYEAKPQDGYLASSWSRNISVTNYTHDATLTYNVENTPTRYRFIKLDSNGEVLAGCDFELYDADQNLVASWTTDSTGVYELIGELIEGESYTIKEVDCPIGYTIAEEQTFTVSSQAKWIEVTIENAILTGSVTVNKYVNGSLSSGAVYAIASTRVITGADTYQSDGMTYYVISAAEAVNGSITFDSLDVVNGYHYILIEVKSPEGTVLLKDPIVIGTLPQEVSGTLSPDYTGITQEKNGVMYLYDLTINVSNAAQFVIPSTGMINHAVYGIPVVFAVMTMIGLAAFNIFSKNKEEN